jgi:hypothetical protein
MKMGTASFTHAHTSDGGLTESVHITIEVKRTEKGGELHRMEHEDVATFGPDLMLRTESEVGHEAGVEDKVTLAVADKSITVEVSKLAHHEQKTLSLPEDWSNDLVVYEALRAQAEAGAPLPLERAYSDFSEKHMDFQKATMKLDEHTHIETPGGPVDAWKIEIHHDEGDTTLTLDKGGLPLAFEMDGLVGVASGAKGKEQSFEVNPELPVEGRLDEHAKELHVDVTVTGDGSNATPAFVDSPYQHVERSADVYSLTLMPRHATLDGPAPALPIAAPPDVARFLAPTADSQSDDPGIVAKAKEIIGAERDSRAAAHAIVRWVYQTLEKRDGIRGTASAVETLASRRGDCTEHAALVVALARAVGIPARNTSGIVLVGGTPPRAGYHEWPELWLGEWVIMDAALGRYDVGPTYIWLEYDEPSEVSSHAMFRLIGKTRIKVK